MDRKQWLRKWVPQVGLANMQNRDAWVQATLASLPEGARLLDAGAGPQNYRKFCANLDYVSQDFAKYDGKGDGSGLHTQVFDYGELDIISDITAIPEPDASFDAIMCIEVFEHLPDPLAALKELARLLKPGGTMVLSAPFCSLTHFAPYHFSSGLNRYWYSKHLQALGFTEISITPNGNYFEFVAQEIYRIRSVASHYVGRKPNVFQLFCIYVLQRMLLRYSKRDRGSSELLCYGFHVLAKKPLSVAPPTA